VRQPCQVCGRPARDAFVCGKCGHDVGLDLAETPWLLRELELVLTRQAVYSSRYGSTRTVGKATPLVFDLRASACLRELDRVLAAATRAVHIVPVTLAGDHHVAWNVQHRADALLLKLDELRRVVVDAGVHVEAIRRAYDRLRSAIDRPADRWYAGPCWICNRDLYALVGRPVAECACGAQYDVQTRRDYLLREADDQLQNAATIARAVSWLGAEPLTAARVRKWAERGRIKAKAYARCEAHRHEYVPPSTCKACSPLYRVGDARDLLAADTNRKERTS